MSFYYIVGILSVMVSLIGITESECGGFVAEIKSNVIPTGIRDADFHLHQSCDSDAHCMRLCRTHSDQCNVAVYDQDNNTCGLVCTPEEGQFQVRTGVTSFVNTAKSKQDYTIEGGELVYPIVGGLTPGRVVHIYGEYKTLNDQYGIMLTNAEKTELVFMFNPRYMYGWVVLSHCRYLNPLIFPARSGCTWQAEDIQAPPPSQSGSKFEIQVFAKSASEFGLRIDDGYEVTYSNGLGIAMEDITWLVVWDDQEQLNMEHLCIW